MAIYIMIIITLSTDKMKVLSGTEKFGNHEHYCVHVFYCTGVIVYKPTANYKLQ